jgi:ribosomal protein S18 acetylase RimI-like enzyme
MATEPRPGGLTIRAIQPADYATVCDIVTILFEAFVAPRVTPERRARFLAQTQPAKLAERIAEGHRYAVALLRGRPVGVVGIGLNHHLYWLWVDAACHRRGIAARLLEYARAMLLEADPAATRMTVNASDYAVPIYRRMGFVATGEEQLRAGVPVTPMRLDLRPPAG